MRKRQVATPVTRQPRQESSSLCCVGDLCGSSQRVVVGLVQVLHPAAFQGGSSSSFRDLFRCDRTLAENMRYQSITGISNNAECVVRGLDQNEECSIQHHGGSLLDHRSSIIITPGSPAWRQPKTKRYSRQIPPDSFHSVSELTKIP